MNLAILWSWRFLSEAGAVTAKRGAAEPALEVSIIEDYRDPDSIGVTS